ncbi:MAG TPA: sigma-70 family RNA polymerase sigma factor [Polyangiaceae bacterium]|nr:sigma-70 family RNA polymerase sigma factor [Polyangiaceae bacterium]
MTSPLASYPADSQRLQRAVHEHYEFVWRALRRLGVAEHSVEDALQQVLVVLARRLGEVRLGAERAFMVATATRVAADFRKMSSRRREDFDAEALERRVSDRPLADEMLDREWARRLLDVVLDQMPDDLRTVFIFFEFEDMSSVAIAELLDLPVGTVASRLRRARQSFEILAARLAKTRSTP